MKAIRWRLHLSTVILITIGLVDLCSTLLLVQLGMKEGNPFFAYYLSNPLAFAAAKLAFLAAPVALLEIARKYRPHSAEQGTWIAAIGYFALYAGHLLAYAR